MATINIYNGTIIAGQKTGDVVTYANPVRSGAIARLPYAKVNGAWIPLGVRCTDDYRTYEEDSRHLRIAVSGESINWQLALDTSSPASAGQPIDFTTVITDVNTIFWVRGVTQEGEDPINDATITLQLSGYVEAVA